MKITKSTQRVLATPPMSWLRKMSANTVMSSQIQMKNNVNQMNDQNTWPTPQSSASIEPPALAWLTQAASMIRGATSSSVSGDTRGVRNPDQAFVASARASAAAYDRLASPSRRAGSAGHPNPSRNERSSSSNQCPGPTYVPYFVSRVS